MIGKLTTKKGIVAPRGFEAAAVAAGIRKSGRKDMMLLNSVQPATAAGIFTVNQFAAAPVQLSKRALTLSSKHRAILINSGSANACTGKQGYQDAEELCDAVSKTLGCLSKELLIASTGVIGERLPVGKMKKNIPFLTNQLQSKHGLDAAKAIMTTDTMPKLAEISTTINGECVTIGGMAKGSGMIHPNMATMLAVVTTDIACSKTELKQFLKAAAAGTFNAISVDGENSTNDTVFIMANGAAGKASRPVTAKAKQQFLDALTEILDYLAEMIVKDGEGASKFMAIRVEGALNNRQAMVAARAIGDSQLVKTAVYGEDANWGRILQSLGATNVKLDTTKVNVMINNVPLVRGGMDAGTSFAKGNQALKKKRINMIVQLGSGKGCAQYRTCDLTRGYIDINAGYRS